ncbi:MAG TPA: hypothetical protein VJ722_06000 [Rhodanobacteraceae bacterium]|nr:hypothetical protein [Rhodanobacteraceae bacterium]
MIRLAVAVAALLCASLDASAAPSEHFLRPELEVGEHLTSVFSKAVDIAGPGFQEVVHRTSGTGEEVVTRIDGGDITFRATVRYDGRPVQNGTDKRLADGTTECWNDHCAVNDSTSGLLFNRYLWGEVPDNIEAGSSWTATIGKPWEIGPPGTERVRVLRLDAPNGGITLTREGTGAGASSDDARQPQITITTNDGRSLRVKLIPGESHWSGYTTIRKGVIVGDEILLERPVTLVAGTGEKFQGKERVYTLENLAQDQR